MIIDMQMEKNKDVVLGDVLVLKGREGYFMVIGDGIGLDERGHYLKLLNLESFEVLGSYESMAKLLEEGVQRIVPREEVNIVLGLERSRVKDGLRGLGYKSGESN